MNRNLIVFKDPETLADQFSDKLMSWIAASGGSHYHLAISGGSTPKLLFTALALKYATSTLWEKTHFWWVDERMVPAGDPESNFGVARQLLFSKISIPEKNIHPVNGENDPFAESENYAQQIKGEMDIISGWPEFDLIILGIGEDGHTASIFPNQTELLKSERICEVAHHPVTGQSRITLTGMQINYADKICFLVTGASKAERFKEIWMKEEKAKLLPAAHIRPVNGELYWFTDQAATQLLP